MTNSFADLTTVVYFKKLAFSKSVIFFHFQEMDFLNCEGELKDFDLCIDKGTFDAISLNPDNTKEGKRLYVQALKDSLKSQGFFAITSCNWTKEQLLERFSEGNDSCLYVSCWKMLCSIVNHFMNQ